MAGSGVVMQSCRLSTARMSLVDYNSIREFGRLRAASISSGADREIHDWHRNHRRRNSVEAGVLKIRNSSSAGDSSYSRLPPHGSQSHATHSKLQAATGRLTQTAPDQLLTVEQTISTSQSTLETRLPAAEDEQMNEWIENVRSHLANVSTSVDSILRIVDRLERLGLSRYFEQEIITCLQYVYKYWSNEDGLGRESGTSSAIMTVLEELNATATAFRLLRSHGFDVKEDCFERFAYRDGEFLGKAEPGSAVSAMLSLLRASQTLFPGERLLKDARAFTRNYLKRKLESNECGDHAAEVEYALKFPWYTSLPRLEHRAYLEDCHDTDGEFLRLAKADFNRCQEMHKKELEQVIRWNARCKFPDLEFARQKYLECYFSAAATIFEPDMAQARVVWAQCYVLITVLDDYFDNCAPLHELRIFLQAVRAWDPSLVQALPARAIILFLGLYDTVNAIAADAFIAQGRDVSHHLRSYWDRWLTACLTEAEWAESGYVPSFDEYMAIAEVTISLETIVCSAFFFAGDKLSEEVLLSPDYHTPLHLVCRVGRLLNDVTGIERETLEGKKSSVHLYMLEHPKVFESDAVAYIQGYADDTMQQLTSDVLQATALPQSSKLLHLHMAKVMHTFYRDSDAYSASTNLLFESIDKVLFTPMTN